MIFCVLNPEKIWHQQLVRLPTSPVYCSYFTLGNPNKVIITVLFTHTSNYLRYLRRKQTVNFLPTTPENVTALPCKLHKFFIFHFFREYRVPIRGTDELRVSCCDMGWISAQRGGRCSWLVAKKTGSMYPCRRWSFWTFAVTFVCPTFHCDTSQPVLFKATNANPQPAFFRVTNVWRNATYLQSDEKVVHFTR